MKKVTLLFPRNPSLKIKILSSPPLFLNIWLEAQPKRPLPLPPPTERRGGGCTLWFSNLLAVCNNFLSGGGKKIAGIFFFLKNQIFITKEYI